MFVSFYCLELRVTLAWCCHLVPSEGYSYISVLDSCSSDFIAAACVYGIIRLETCYEGFVPRVTVWFFRTRAGLSARDAAKLTVWFGYWFGMFCFNGLSKQSKRKSWTCVEFVCTYWSCSMFLLARSKEGLSQKLNCPVSATPGVLKYQCSNWCALHFNLLSDFFCSPQECILGKRSRLNMYRAWLDFSFLHYFWKFGCYW